MGWREELEASAARRIEQTADRLAQEQEVDALEAELREAAGGELDVMTRRQILIMRMNLKIWQEFSNVHNRIDELEAAILTLAERLDHLDPGKP
ncbi:MAG TPA: hypothetical protein VD790_11380 [Thermoleophilaceae bacterium]|nr:hypothetical protein [Thermoleophilaceae bacterium]